MNDPQHNVLQDELIRALKAYLAYEKIAEFSIPIEGKYLVYSSVGLVTGATGLGGQ